MNSKTKTKGRWAHPAGTAPMTAAGLRMGRGSVATFANTIMTYQCAIL